VLGEFVQENGKHIKNLQRSEPSQSAQPAVAQERIFSDKAGIVVKFIHGNVVKTPPKEKKVIHIKLFNKSAHVRTLMSWRLIDKFAHMVLADEFGCHAGEPVELPENSTEFLLTVTYTPTDIETWEGIIEFKFDSFTILKPIQFICETDELAIMKSSVQEYRRPQPSSVEYFVIESQGEPPARSESFAIYFTFIYIHSSCFCL
jgi:hypothetical protein